jgi:hypothetical protein
LIGISEEFGFEVQKNYVTYGFAIKVGKRESFEKVDSK